ncbi:hypothetical protein OCT63_06950 [Vibrio sp. RW]|uniref:hypothetical protein n=1 Tax=Vibrio sp. RW TaxID=2998833 RepID=UPI0022CD7753|nr:hypothetical protein [Vibrio sp. RW]MDA0143973.1 hypothetical protein [Vibrio sp. RW]
MFESVSIHFKTLTTADYIAIISVFFSIVIAFISLYYTHVCRGRDQRRELVLSIERKHLEALDTAYKMKLDCITLKQKFELSDISNIDMQSYIQSIEEMILEPLHNNATVMMEQFKLESAKMSIKQLEEHLSIIDSFILNLQSNRDNFKERIELGYDQLDKKWSEALRSTS